MRSRTLARIASVPMSIPTLRTALWLAAALAGAAVVWWAQRPAPPDWQAATVFAEQSRPLSTAALVRDDASPLVAADFEGRLSLLFLGYSRCPDICAPTLLLLSRIARDLDDPRLQTVFASMDPAHDTPEVLRTHLARFDMAAFGVTGAPKAMARLARDLGGYAQRADNDLIDHSSAVWVIDARARIAGVFTAPLDAQRMTADVRRMLEDAA